MRALIDGSAKRKCLLADALMQKSVSLYRAKNLRDAAKSGEEAENLLTEALAMEADGHTYRRKSEAAWNLVSIYSGASQAKAAEAARTRMRYAADQAQALDGSDVIASSLKFTSIWWEACLRLAQGDIPAAREAAQSAREAAELTKSLDEQAVAAIDNEYWAIAIMARVEFADGRGTTGLQLLREAAAVAARGRDLDASSMSDRVRALNAQRELAVNLWDGGEKSEGLEELQTVLTVLRSLSDQEPASIEIRSDLIEVMGLTGEFLAKSDASAAPEGLALAEEAVRHAKTLAVTSKQGDFDDVLNGAVRCLSLALLAVGEKERAAAEFGASVDAERKATQKIVADLPLAPFGLAGTLINYCDLLNEAGRASDARAIAEEAVALCEGVKSVPIPTAERRTYHLALDRYADFFEAEGNYAGARALLEKCLQEADTALSRDPASKAAQADKRWIDYRMRKIQLLEQRVQT